MSSNSRLTRIALTLAIIALLIFIVDRLWTFGQFIGPVVSTLAAAWFLAFLIKPPIRRLRKGIVPNFIIQDVRKRYGNGPASKLRMIRLPMWLAVAIVYLVVLFVITGLATLATATIIPQAAELIRRLPDFINALPAEVAQFWTGFAQRFGLDPDALNQLITVRELTLPATQAAGIAASQLLNFAALTATLVGQTFLVIVLSLYIVVEDQQVGRQFLMVLPARMHETARAMYGAIDRAFSGYLRGQVVGAVLRGLFTLIVFQVFNVSFGVVVAIVFALLSFVPLIGGPVGIVIAGVVTQIVQPDAVVPVVLLIFAFDQLVAYGVLPRLMKDMVGVPSLVALLAISVGVQLLGFWGLVFGVPIVGAIYAVVFEFYLPRRRAADGELAPKSASPPAAEAVTDKTQGAPVDLPREEPKGPTLKGTR
jgi:predicted PurR-regulated permease PerM